MSKKREFGRTLILREKSLLTKNFFTKKTAVWMSHEDGVIKLPKNFQIIGSTKKNQKLTIIENFKKKIFGVQFHPVTHTDNGKKIFYNFLFLICKIKKRWNVVSQKNRLINEIRQIVGKDKVICAFYQEVWIVVLLHF